MSVLFIAFLIRPISPAEMEHDQHFTKIETNFFNGIVENLEIDRGKPLLRDGHVVDILKSLREVIVIRLSLHRDRAQNLNISIRVRFRLDNVRVDVHLIESAAHRCGIFASEFFPFSTMVLSAKPSSRAISPLNVM